MATNPNIEVLDKDGNPIEDRQIEVNGILPGEGGGGESYWLLDNGTLVPEGSVSEIDMTTVTAKVAAPSSSAHPARKQDVDAVSSEIDALGAADVGAIPTDEKGAASGVATLDSDGDLETGQVPSIVITDVYVIGTESELTGLDANQGDVGIATDVQGSWILASDDPTVASNWKELKTDAPPVQEVFGRTGSVTAQSGDYSEHYAPLEEGVARGPIADRPDTGPYDDYLYRATDQGVTWRWDETAADWSEFGHGSESQPVPEGHYGSLNTDQLYSAESDVNYAAPGWQAKTDAISFLTNFESLDGLGQTASGSATVGLNEYRVQLSTGTTSGSTARLRATLGTNIALKTWEKDRVLRTNVFVPNVGSGDEFYVVTGAVSDGDKTTPHFGFYHDGSDLYGTVGNGSAQQTTLLQSGVAGDFGLRAELTSGDKVEFYENDTLEGTISSGIPTGGSDADHQFTLFTKNGSSNNRTISCDTMRVVQAP